MPPKVKVTGEEIVRAALELVQREGKDALNARALAAMLQCSTQPVFSNFATMEELERAVRRAAYGRYFAFLEKEVAAGKHPPYKALGMAYIRFAREERELFKMLFMCDRSRMEASETDTSDFNAAVAMIAEANGFDMETARLIHLETWSCAHGIASMIATSFLTLEEETASSILSDVYRGIIAKHRADRQEKEDGKYGSHQN